MSETIFLKGETPGGLAVVLRPLETGDIEQCLRWINDPELRPVLETTFPMSRDAERAWLEANTKAPGKNPQNLVFAIMVEDQHVGNIGIHSISLVHRHATTGLAIGEKEHRGRQIGPTAKRLLIDYAFGELNLLRLRADVIEGNARSIRMQEKCGYTQVGRLPQWFFKDGQWKDLLIFVLEREQWAASA